VRRRLALLSVTLAGAAIVTALSAAGPGRSDPPAQSGIVTTSAGQLRINGDTGTGYIDLHNASAKQVVVQAAVSPAAASVLWTTSQQVVTSAHLFTASALCEDEPSLEAAANAAALRLHDLVIGPGASLSLRPGSGSLELTELVGGLRRGDRVPVTLYLDNGQQLVSTLTVV
jgi:copper(I)-binding protein